MSENDLFYLTQASRKPREVKERRLTVSYIHFDNTEVPYIRLSGLWLGRRGFSRGKKIIVREEWGRLVIELVEEAEG